MSDTPPPDAPTSNALPGDVAAAAMLSEELQPYSYAPLDREAKQIRLLVLQPAEDTSVLRCELVPVSLDDGIEYIALSYAWNSGNALTESAEAGSEFEDIIIDDQSVLEITTSLAGALHRLRNPDSIVPIWADAVCINQADLQERSEQVMMMRSIYEKAGQVVIWLGETTKMSELACSFVKNVETCPVEELAVTILETKGEAANIKLLLLALMDLFGRPWWHRLWIVQEIAVPKTDPIIAYGGTVISWSEIEKLKRMAYETKQGEGFWSIMNASGMGIIKELISIRQTIQLGEAMSFSRLLIASIRRKCSQPLDQVYALLGLASAEIQHAIPIDYGKKLEEVFLDVARACILRGEGLNLLSSVQRSQPVSSLHLEDWQFEMLKAQREEEMSKLVLPSWVPDWSVPFNQRLSSLHRDGCYRASEGAAQEVSFSNDLQRLTVTGIHFDCVKVIHTAAFNAGKFRASMESLIDTLSVAAHLYIADPEHRAAALSSWLWRTLIANRSPAGEVPAPEELGFMFKVFCRWAEVPDTFEPDMKGKDTPVTRWSKYVSHLIAPVNETMGHRRFFVTQRGYFGVGPEDMKLGDGVCILFGADMPFVLREKEDHWSLIGECYVHNAMDGEIIKLQRDKPQEFAIARFSVE